MADIIILAGDTGSGKSRSLKNLNSKETIVIQPEPKSLPWKDSSKHYCIENKNFVVTDNYTIIQQTLNKISKERIEIKTVLLDDSGLLMSGELFQRAKETGYNKFTEIGLHMQSLIRFAGSLRKDLTIVFTFHTDTEYSDKIMRSLKLKTIGQLLEDKYNPLATVTIALFSVVSFDDEGKAKYNFITNRCIVDGLIIPAKSPEGMFPELIIENDLNYVIQTKNKYY
jgi:hypothetical protein